MVDETPIIKLRIPKIYLMILEEERNQAQRRKYLRRIQRNIDVENGTVDAMGFGYQDWDRDD